MLLRAYFEFARFLKIQRYLFALLQPADKWALAAAFMMFFSLYAPWISLNSFSKIGIMSGGELHLFFSLMAMRQVMEVAKCHARMFRKKRISLLSFEKRLKRLSLGYILIGFASSLSLIILLLVYGSYNRFLGGGLDMHLGFYGQIISSLILIFCGFAHFKK